MATPLSNARMLAALKREGCTVREVSGWQTRNRNHKGAWGPVYGIVVHHTGSDAQGTGYVSNILASGYAGLPGPLCHVGIDMAGTVHLVSNGRANHAGRGDGAVLDRVIREDGALMRGETKPRTDDTDGNSRLYGAEVMYDGGQPMTPEQLDATVRWCAAICRAHGWSAASIIGHREWTRTKIDPGHQDMVQLRRLVQARLDADKPAAVVGEQEWTDMATKKELEDIVRTVVRQELNKPFAGAWLATFGKGADGKPRQAMQAIRDLVQGVKK